MKGLIGSISIKCAATHKTYSVVIILHETFQYGGSNLHAGILGYTCGTASPFPGRASNNKSISATVV